MKANIKNKIIIGLIATLGLFATGLSCGGKNQPTGETANLTIWKPFDPSEYWNEIINAYTRTHPGVRITYIQKNPDDYEQDLLESMAVDQAPDIYSIRNDWLPRYSNKIAPQENVDIRQLRSTFAAIVADDLVRNGKLYGLPMSVDVLALYYNRALLASAGYARPPATWPELIDMVARLTRQGANGRFTQSAIALGTAGNVRNAADIASVLMLQGGTNFYNDTYTATRLSQGQADERREVPAARALRFFSQFSDPASTVYTWNQQRPDSLDAFSSGTVAFMLGYSYLLPTLQAKNAFADFAVAGLPQPNLNAPKVNLGSYWAETVWSGSKNSAVAWDFLNFATSYEQNKNYVAKTKQPSSRLDVLTEQQKDPVLGPFADNVYSARSVVKPEATEFDKIMTEALDDVSLVGLTPNEALERLEDRLKLLLDKYPVRF